MLAELNRTAGTTHDWNHLKSNNSTKRLYKPTDKYSYNLEYIHGQENVLECFRVLAHVVIMCSVVQTVESAFLPQIVITNAGDACKKVNQVKWLDGNSI